MATPCFIVYATCCLTSIINPWTTIISIVFWYLYGGIAGADRQLTIHIVFPHVIREILPAMMVLYIVILKTVILS